MRGAAPTDKVGSSEGWEMGPYWKFQFRFKRGSNLAGQPEAPRRQLHGWRPAYRLTSGHFVIVATVLAGCAGSFYDLTTIRNLGALETKVAMLYEGFIQETINPDKIAEIGLDLTLAYEHERGKSANRETARQVQIIREMFDRHVDHRVKQGRWSTTFMQNARQNIQDAFDIAIRTERLKWLGPAYNPPVPAYNPPGR